MIECTPQQKIHYTLRLAVAMCFVGHGAFGLITKPIWANYFAVFGIGHDLAYRLMPVVGGIDVLMGVGMLFYPLAGFPAWLVLWGIVTALLRPLSGEPLAEFIERAGNFGAPLALLMLSGLDMKKPSSWWTRLSPFQLDDTKSYERASYCLRAVVFLLLFGHGWLNWIGKNALLDQYHGLGFSSTAQVAQVVGLAEILASCAVLLQPWRPMLMALFIWKVASELFYPHYELMEWIERGGSYGAILALWLITGVLRDRKANRTNSLGQRPVAV